MEEYLTKEQIAAYQEAFNSIDKDGDGHIAIQELATVWSVSEPFGHKFTHEHWGDMIKMVDINENGTIEFNEFSMLMYQITPKEKKETYTEEELEHAFKRHDRDQNGYLSGMEVRNAMFHLEVGLPALEAWQIIEEADTDGDGLVNYKEFVKIMKAVAVREFAK